MTDGSDEWGTPWKRGAWLAALATFWAVVAAGGVVWISQGAFWRVGVFMVVMLGVTEILWSLRYLGAPPRPESRKERASAAILENMLREDRGEDPLPLPGREGADDRDGERETGGHR